VADKSLKTPITLSRPGSACPPYRYGSIKGLLEEYQKELSEKEFIDPCGIKVTFLVQNFPKLVQLEFKHGKAKAQKFLESIRLGNFKESDYTWDAWRASSLFWIADVIVNPDLIGHNCHNAIVGDRVYVKQYSKHGPPYKIVFTWPDRESKLRVVTTSFFTKEVRLKRFLSDPPIWEKRKGHPEG
jgi:hypothetical protein